MERERFIIYEIYLILYFEAQRRRKGDIYYILDCNLFYLIGVLVYDLNTCFNTCH